MTLASAAVSATRFSGFIMMLLVMQRLVAEAPPSADSEALERPRWQTYNSLSPVQVTSPRTA